MTSTNFGSMLIFTSCVVGAWDLALVLELSGVSLCWLLLAFFILLGFVHWFGFLGGMRYCRFQLRVLKRISYVSVWACSVRTLTSDFTFMLSGGLGLASAMM